MRNVCVFEWRTRRSAACLQDIMPADFNGILQCDGYIGYECSSSSRPKPRPLNGSPLNKPSSRLQ